MILSLCQIEEIGAAVIKDFNEFFFHDSIKPREELVRATPIDQFAHKYLGLSVGYARLTRAHVPVYLVEAQALADRLAEKEKIGIVPEGVIPAYCGNWFPNEHIIDYMNLPDEDRDKFLPFCTWLEEQPVALQEAEGSSFE